MERNNRRRYGLYFYAAFIIFMVLRWWNGLLLSQLDQNPISSPRIDPLVWLFQFSGIPELLSSENYAAYYDLIIFALSFFIFHSFWKGKHPKALIIIHSVLFALYVLTVYCYPTLSIRKYLGLVLIPIAFYFKSDLRYKNTIEVLRYYVCFIFSSAALWKIARGGVFDSDQMILTLKAQHIDNFVHYPEHFITLIVGWLISNPNFCQFLLIGAVLLQSCFVLGFITKKYDRLLLFLLMIFILSDFLIMRIEYWEFVVFFPLFFVQSKTKKTQTLV